MKFPNNHQMIKSKMKGKKGGATKPDCVIMNQNGKSRFLNSLYYETRFACSTCHQGRETGHTILFNIFIY
jgi:hypothetical protein